MDALLGALWRHFRQQGFRHNKPPKMSHVDLFLRNLGEVSLKLILLLTLTAELQRRIQAMEMRCYRKILHILYKDHVTNEEVRAKIQQAIWTTRRSPDDRKETQSAVVWSCFPFIRSGQNHLARHSERGKKTRRTKTKRWEDNIREWTGLEFGKSQRAAENRESGENWLQNHLWCPNDPPG